MCVPWFVVDATHKIAPGHQERRNLVSCLESLVFRDPSTKIKSSPVPTAQRYTHKVTLEQQSYKVFSTRNAVDTSPSTEMRVQRRRDGWTSKAVVAR